MDNLSGLSAEEEAALEDELNSEEGLDEELDEELEDEIVAESKDEEAVDSPDEETVDEEIKAGADDPSPADDPKDDVEEDVAITPKEFTPEYKVDAPEDLTDQLAAVSDKITALDEQLEDGDIDLTDYRKQMREHSQSREELIALKTKQEISSEMNQQSAEQRWEWEQDLFMSEKTSEIYKTEPAMHAALDATIKTVGSEEGWREKTGLDVLREADRRVKSLMGVKPPKLESVPAPEPKPQIPQTLSNIPSADTNIEGGEFDFIDKLDGMEQEAAIAKLSAEQYDRYLAVG